MKRQIRCGVFETNSSSVHTLTICDLDTYEKWINGELLFDKWSEKFIKPIPKLSDLQKDDAKKAYIKSMKTYWKEWDELSIEEKEKWYCEYGLNHGLLSEGAQTYDEYFDNSYTYAENYTTQSGDNIVVFGYYGCD